jgi:hypothetical protein
MPASAFQAELFRTKNAFLLPRNAGAIILWASKAQNFAKNSDPVKPLKKLEVQEEAQ